MILCLNNRFDIFISHITYIEKDLNENKLYIHLTMEKLKEVIKLKSVDETETLFQKIIEYLSKFCPISKYNDNIVFNLLSVNSLDRDYRNNRLYIKMSSYKYLCRFDNREQMEKFCEQIRSDYLNYYVLKPSDINENIENITF